MERKLHVSVLQQLYLNQKQAATKHQMEGNTWWRGKYRFYFIGMVIGVLAGGIPLAIFVSMYTKHQKTTAVSTGAPSVVLRWRPAGITVAGLTAVSGNASNLLYRPYHMTVDYSHTLYIADRFNNRAQKYLMGASNGSTVAGQANGSGGVGSNQLNNPTGVAVNSNGGVFVADNSNNRIQFWANGALDGTTIAGASTSIPGNSSNSLNRPAGVALDSNTGTLYITDNFNQRVMSYAAGASSGTVVVGNNGLGIKSTQLLYPFGIYVDSTSNSLAISYTGSHNVVQWVLGHATWKILAGSINGTMGNTSTLLNTPRGVALDPMGNIYVADTDNHRIQLFMSGMNEGITIAGAMGIDGSNATLLNKPYSIVLDSQLNFYVADTYNHRIQKFIRY